MSVSSRQIVDIMSKLYQAHGACVKHPAWKSRFPKFRELIAVKADMEDIDRLQATIDLLKRWPSNPDLQMWIMAAYVEMVEGSE